MTAATSIGALQLPSRRVRRRWRPPRQSSPCSPAGPFYVRVRPYGAASHGERTGDSPAEELRSAVHVLLPVGCWSVGKRVEGPRGAQSHDPCAHTNRTHAGAGLASAAERGLHMRPASQPSRSARLAACACGMALQQHPDRGTQLHGEPRACPTTTRPVGTPPSLSGPPLPRPILAPCGLYMHVKGAGRAGSSGRPARRRTGGRSG